MAAHRPKLILASTSPYRRELLARLGLPFETRAPGTDESARPAEPPRARAERLAAAKARAVDADDAVVIGSDQVASLDGRLLHKPGRHDLALAQLESCAGKTVLFHTAVHVRSTASGRALSHVDETAVRFRTLGRAALARYLEIEQPYDCAGSFKSEGLGVALFERIESKDPTALVGLPLIWLAHALELMGIGPLEPRA